MPRRSRLLSVVCSLSIVAALLLLTILDLRLPIRVFGNDFFIDDVKLTPLLLVIGIAATYLNHRERRFPIGHCQKCGYDLTGVRTGRCPECGTPCYHWMDDKSLPRPNYCPTCGADVREDHGPKCPSCGSVIA